MPRVYATMTAYEEWQKTAKYPKSTGDAFDAGYDFAVKEVENFYSEENVYKRKRAHEERVEAAYQEWKRLSSMQVK